MEAGPVAILPALTTHEKNIQGARADLQRAQNLNETRFRGKEDA